MTAQTASGSRREARAGWFLRRRWRRVDRAATGLIAVVAVVAAVQLGVSAPAVSPVQPPAAQAVATDTGQPTGQATGGAPAANDPGPLVTRFGGGRRGDRGRGGDRGGFR